MINEVLIGSSIATLSGGLGFLISRKIIMSRFNIYVDQAQAKAKAIESEAELMLHKSSIKAGEIELEAKKVYEDASSKAKKDLSEREENVSRLEFESELNLKKVKEQISSDKKSLEQAKSDFKRHELKIEKLKDEYLEKKSVIINALENVSSLSVEDAQKMLIEQLEEQTRAQCALKVKKIEDMASRDAKKKANYILAQATSRFAGDFATERLVNKVTLKDDELKGRIIGKEGRNIKALENILGVDIIIDDTPGAILVSSFNLYRRAIATKTLELLIEDGRIQPAKIEEIYEKVFAEFDENILHEGEEICLDLGVGTMDVELMKLIGRLRFRASYGQNALAHTLEVAHLAAIMAAEMGGNPIKAKRAGLLHDIGKALTHDKDGNHVDLGAQVCRDHNEDDVVINAIYAHHGHEEINSIECAAVCAADALSAARPGARREVLESYLKRVKDIEDIAFTKKGVKAAYAINAGREVRVIVNAQLINDSESTLLANEIAKEIESKVQYPGEIKVNVIRENRSIAFAS